MSCHGDKIRSSKYENKFSRKVTVLKGCLIEDKVWKQRDSGGGGGGNPGEISGKGAGSVHSLRLSLLCIRF